jgi:RNA polymerase primary sigma factor
MGKYYSKSDNSEKSSLSYYLNEIFKIPLLSSEEEIELGKIIANGDKEEADKRVKDEAKVAVKKLVRHNLKFVVNIAKKYQGRGVSLENLISGGNMGLIKAAEKFDYTRNVHFITYGVWWIRQSILREISETSRTIRIPINRLNEINNLNREIYSLKLEDSSLNFNKLIEKVAKETGKSAEEVKNLLMDSREVYSLDEPIRDMEEHTLGDTIASDYYSPEKEGIDKQSKKEILDYIKGILSSQEEAIIKYRFGIESNPMTLEEVGNIFGLTRERIRQIEERALKKLKPKKTFDEIFLNGNSKGYKKF